VLSICIIYDYTTKYEICALEFMGYVFPSARMPVCLSLCKIPARRACYLLTNGMTMQFLSYYFPALLGPLAVATMHLARPKGLAKKNIRRSQLIVVESICILPENINNILCLLVTRGVYSLKYWPLAVTFDQEGSSHSTAKWFGPEVLHKALRHRHECGLYKSTERATASETTEDASKALRH